MIRQQPWLARPWVDIIFILLPPFISLLVIMLFPSLFQNSKDMSIAGWVILVLLIDVAHVYSTLYRTYFDPHSLKKQRSLLWSIPVTALVCGIILYSINDLLFWRILAYVAVFHFIRQQYGFMRLYSRKEVSSKYEQIIDKVVIYYATLYPILYWHFYGPRNFNWFMEKDFVYVRSEFMLILCTVIYFVILTIYLIKEILFVIKNRNFNIPKFLIISGTILSWYFGIVYYNGDMAFTLLNVVSHGIPYMAMVWIYGQKNYTRPGKGSKFLKLVFSRYGIICFIALLCVFAFVEEGLWDITLWKEHESIFGTESLPELKLSHSVLSIIVPLLALPQVTHYILDGFIWKIKKDEIKWNNEV